jgi:hypothetical protein
MAVNQAGTDAAPFQIGALDRHPANLRGLAADPGNPALGRKDMPVPVRPRAEEVRIEEKLQHGQEVIPRGRRT